MELNTIERLIVTNPIRHSIQRYWEIPRLLNKGPHIPQGSQILEIGCGSGNGAKSLIEILKPSHLTTLDYDQRMVDLASKRLKGVHNVIVMQQDATNLPFADNSFHAIFDMAVLHHIPQWQEALKELHRVLKPGGILYIEEFYKRLICNPVIKHIIHHPQENRFSHAELLAEAQKLGFEIHFKNTFFDLSGTLVLQKH